jgi:tRNA A-37 threonylcarbamoyl transferase component Bud32
MDITETMHFGALAIKVGLITQAQLDEALDEAREESGQQMPPLIYLTRVLERRGLITNFQTSKVLRGDMDGYFMGGYKILYKISSGSFGRVFRAEDPYSHRTVAVKVLRRRWSDDQQRIDLFIREGKVGLTLKHDNIVEVMGINQDALTRQYYILMEFVEGGNLREMLAIRRLSVAESLKILEDCAAGLAYAYSRGYTHRDIKLTNILINTQGEAKLVDFGLAQMFAQIGREEEMVDRTVDYAGLEKTTEVKMGDVRSDIFFLGCVLYEMLTGRPPLEMTKDRHARMHKRRFVEMLKLRPGDIDAPPSVYQLVESMMAYDPRRRYQTPSQLLDAVRAARREVLGGVVASRNGAGAAGGPKGDQSVYLVEGNHNLQEALRAKFKEKGYRPFVATDPMRAVERFNRQPFDVLIVNAETAGEEGVEVFDHVLQEAHDKQMPCVGVLVLGEEQAEWARKTKPRPNGRVLVRPVSWKQLWAAVQTLQKQREKQTDGE